MPRSIPSLTGIRGVAALWVVLFHMWYLPGAPAVLKLPVVNQIVGNGWIGVDLFFLLSGFILMHTHMSDFEFSPIEGAPGFYKSRFLRVYPLNAVVLFLIALLVAADPAFALHQGNLSLAGFLETWTLSTRWMLPWHGEWNEPVWSLSAEVVGYAAFPVLAFLIAKVRSPKLAFGSASGCLLMLLAQLWHRHSLGDNVINGPTAIFRMATEFTAGIAAYRLRTLVGELRGVNAIELLLVAALAIILLIPKGPALAPFLFAGLIYVLSFRSDGPLDRILSSNVAMTLGRLSFPLYLVHLVPLEWLRFYARGWLLDLGYLVLALALSAVLHRYVERPFSIVRVKHRSGQGRSTREREIALVPGLVGSELDNRIGP